MSLSIMDKHTNSAFKVMNQDFMKLDRFDGTNYTRWKDKMMFFLSALKVAYVLDPNLPQIPVSSSDETDYVKEERTKRQEDELLCRGHILNTLSDRLYDLFTSVQSPREIWNVLEFKYRALADSPTPNAISKGVSKSRVTPDSYHSTLSLCDILTMYFHPESLPTLITQL